MVGIQPMNTLKTLRTAAGLTQKQLAIKAGVNLRLVQKYEGGENQMRNMTLGTAQKICAALGVDIQDLLK
jgi:transcriptional regulator with XRE-family HTH domain